jgi:hypothetical protein
MPDLMYRVLIAALLDFVTFALGKAVWPSVLKRLKHIVEQPWLQVLLVGGLFGLMTLAGLFPAAEKSYPIVFPITATARVQPSSPPQNTKATLVVRVRETGSQDPVPGATVGFTCYYKTSAKPREDVGATDRSGVFTHRFRIGPATVGYPVKVSVTVLDGSRFAQAHTVFTPQAKRKSIREPTSVYVTKSGDKYHSAGCPYLSHSSFPRSLAEAKSQGYDP